jgi:hypothetical protein
MLNGNIQALHEELRSTPLSSHLCNTSAELHAKKSLASSPKEPKVSTAICTRNIQQVGQLEYFVLFLSSASLATTPGPVTTAVK